MDAVALARAPNEERRMREWLHWRLLSRNTMGRWSVERHWGNCGLLCPCCHSYFSPPRGCIACDFTADAVSIASKIAGFCGVHPACRIRAASKSNQFLQLPPLVIKLIGGLLPKTPLAHTTLLIARVPWLTFYVIGRI